MGPPQWVFINRMRGNKSEPKSGLASTTEAISFNLTVAGAVQTSLVATTMPPVSTRPNGAVTRTPGRTFSVSSGGTK